MQNVHERPAGLCYDSAKPKKEYGCHSLTHWLIQRLGAEQMLMGILVKYNDLKAGIEC